MTLYSKLLRNIGGITYLGRMDEQVSLRRLDDVPRQTIRAAQLRRINDIWSHAVTHVPHYRDLSRHLSLPGIFRSLDEFSLRVPSLSRKEVQSDPRRFLADTAGSGTWLKTAGSTGRPLWSFRGRKSHQHIRMDAHYQRFRYGVEWNDPGLLLWGGGGFLCRGLSGLRKRLTMRVMDRVKNRWRVKAYELDRADLKRCREILIRHRIRLLYAYTRSAVRLARYCRSLSSRFPDLTLVVISSEPEEPGDVAFMEGAFDCPVAREYGAVEMGVIAVDLPGAPLRVMEHSVFLETLPHRAGMYEILCTNLHNRDFPLIRYPMGDLTSGALQVNPTGPAVLADVAGRRNDMIFLPPDRWVHPIALTHLIHRSPGVRGLQVVVEGERKILIRLETDPVLEPEEREKMRSRILDIMGADAFVDIAENVPFETTSMGKHRFVIRR